MWLKFESVIHVLVQCNSWFVADISKNVLKEHAKAFNQVFDHAKKNLQKVESFVYINCQGLLFLALLSSSCGVTNMTCTVYMYVAFSDLFNTFYNNYTLSST